MYVASSFASGVSISELISSDVPAADVNCSQKTGSRIFRFSRSSRVHPYALFRPIATDRAGRIIAALFLLFVLPTCLLLAVLVPLGEVADENAHILRADALLHGELIGYRRHEVRGGKRLLESGVDCNYALFAAGALFAAVPPGQIGKKKVTPDAIARTQAITWAKSPGFVNSPGAAIYLPAFYIPSAVAIGFAHALHLSPYRAYQSARILNVLCFVGLGVCALLLARRGRLLLFAVLSLPMTVSLASSCNPDGLIIATSVLAFALLTRASEPRGKSYWAAALLLAVVIAVKIPYFPLALLLLIPSFDRNTFPYKKKLPAALRNAVLVVVPGILWLAFSMYHAAIPMLFPPYHPGYLWPGNHNKVFDSANTNEQAKVFLHRPLYPLILPAKTLHAGWLGYRDQMIGRFGWLEFGLPGQMYVFWIFAIACAILSASFEERTYPRGPPALISAIGMIAVGAALCAICDAAYFAWTPVGAPLIQGIQGRYLLPLVAAFAVFIPAFRIRGAVKLKAALAVPALTATAVGMILLPTLMVSTYYLR